MNKLSNKEKVLKFIIESASNGNDNSRYIYNDIIKTTQLNERETVQLIQFLQEDKLIEIIKISPNNDLSFPCVVKLTSSGYSYFEDKEKEINKIKKINRREWVRTYLPIIFSFIALVKSFWPQIMSVVQLLMK